MTVSPVDVSIVIVSLNTRDVLRQCLQSIEREAPEIAKEIIVVDNGSSDGSVEMLQREASVKLLQSAQNLGFGGANNLGLRVASGRYVVLLNSDAFLTPAALQRSIAHMDGCPDVALAGGILLGRDGTLQPSARMFPSVLNDMLTMSGLAARYARSRFFGRLDRTWADPCQAAEVDWVPGAYSILRMETLKQVGFFDPRFFLYYEEVDLCKRLKKAGYTIQYWPDIRVIHLGGESSRQVQSLAISKSGSQLTLWRMRSMLLYYRKHGSTARLAYAFEMLWYWLRAKRRARSSDEGRRETVKGDVQLMFLLQQAWRETKGGRQSPPQPW